MNIPDWTIFALCGVTISTAMPLLQEKLRADGYALALWNKLFSVLLMTPFIVMAGGLPGDPAFYIICALTALLWAVADAVYFKAIPQVGAGVVTRLIPSAIIINFCLWFAFDPALLLTYLANPYKSACIALVILLAAFCASRLTRCAVSWRAVGLIWPVILAAAVGPAIQKLGLSHAPVRYAPYAFVFVQGAMMVFILSLWYAIRRPVSGAVLFSGSSLKAGGLISLFSAGAVVLASFGYIKAEHPAYISLIMLLDSLFILAIHRLTGRRDDSDLVAGFGIVGCAMTLVAIKSLWP